MDIGGFSTAQKTFRYASELKSQIIDWVRVGRNRDLDRKSYAEAPKRLWLAEVTDIPTQSCFLYLSAQGLNGWHLGLRTPGGAPAADAQ